MSLSDIIGTRGYETDEEALWELQRGLGWREVSQCRDKSCICNPARCEETVVTPGSLAEQVLRVRIHEAHAQADLDEAKRDAADELQCTKDDAESRIADIIAERDALIKACNSATNREVDQEEATRAAVAKATASVRAEMQRALDVAHAALRDAQTLNEDNVRLLAVERQEHIATTTKLRAALSDLSMVRALLESERSKAAARAPAQEATTPKQVKPRSKRRAEKQPPQLTAPEYGVSVAVPHLVRVLKSMCSAKAGGLPEESMVILSTEALTGDTTVLTAVASGSVKHGHRPHVRASVLAAGTLGEVAVDASSLYDAIRSSKAHEVILYAETDGGASRLRVNVGGAVTVLPVVADLPYVPRDVDGAPIATVGFSGASFRDALRCTARYEGDSFDIVALQLTGRINTRPELDPGPEVAATDTCRITVARPVVTNAVTAMPGFDTTVPVTMSYRFAKLLRQAMGTSAVPAVEVMAVREPAAKEVAEANWVRMGWQDDSHIRWELTARSPDRPFPRYEQVVPKRYTHRITVDPDAMSTALRQVSDIASTVKNKIALVFSSSTLALCAYNPDLQQRATANVPITWVTAPLGEDQAPQYDMTLYADCRYLLDPMTLARGPVDVRWTNAVMPIVIESGVNGLVIDAVMPINA